MNDNSNYAVRQFLLSPQCALPTRLKHLAWILCELARWDTGEGAVLQGRLAQAYGCKERHMREMLAELEALSGSQGAVLFESWARFRGEDQIANGYRIEASSTPCQLTPASVECGEVSDDRQPSAAEPAVQCPPGGGTVPRRRHHTAYSSSSEANSNHGVGAASRATNTPNMVFEKENSVAGQVTPSGQLARSGGALGPSRKRSGSRVPVSSFVPGAQAASHAEAAGLVLSEVLEAFKAHHEPEEQLKKQAEWAALFGGWLRGAAKRARAPKREPKERPKQTSEKERLEIIEALTYAGISSAQIIKKARDRKVHMACAKLLRIPREDLAWTPGQIEALEETLERLRQ